MLEINTIRTYLFDLQLATVTMFLRKVEAACNTRINYSNKLVLGLVIDMSNVNKWIRV